ncbi:NIPSNAP family protein [Candidatus Poriferisodalis sp.]|uniref:NIPSNAP family protein n=1 Tax=Candidatus Poriferisodalis sp. TaxID=3101277 RepID=UPI003B02921B
MSFVEMRRYRLKVGTPERWVKTYFDKGYEPQRKHLGEPVGYYTTEFGGINEIIHMWRYDSLAERAAKRKALFADPDWQEFVTEIVPLVEAQENAILRDIFED